MTDQLVGLAPEGLEIAESPSQLVGLILVIPDLNRCDEGEAVLTVCEVDDIPAAPCQVVVEIPDDTCRTTVTLPDDACRTEIVIPDEPCREDVLDLD